MAPKGKAKQPKSSAPAPEPPKECTYNLIQLLIPQIHPTLQIQQLTSPDPTISAKREAEYNASRPYQLLKEKKGLSGLSPIEKSAYAIATFLETGAWEGWNDTQQKEFWKSVEQYKIPTPLPKPRDLGKDSSGRDIGSYSLEEFRGYEAGQRDLARLREESDSFRERRRRAGNKWEGEEIEGLIEEERNRRKLLGRLRRKVMGKYEGDPVWDDVVPIPQDDGEGALAQIAYTDEYSEGMFPFSGLGV